MLSTSWLSAQYTSAPRESQQQCTHILDFNGSAVGRSESARSDNVQYHVSGRDMIRHVNRAARIFFFSTRVRENNSISWKVFTRPFCFSNHLESRDDYRPIKGTCRLQPQEGSEREREAIDLTAQRIGETEGGKVRPGEWLWLARSFASRANSHY